MKHYLTPVLLIFSLTLIAVHCSAADDDTPSRTKRVLKSVNPPDRITRVPSTLGGEVEITSTVKMRSGDSTGRTKCNANAGIVYTQMDRQVHVEVTLSHDDCPIASGAYQIRLLTRNEAGEQDVRDFDETWESTNHESETIESLYEMGNDPDLVRAQVRRLSCICSADVEDVNSTDGIEP